MKQPNPLMDLRPRWMILRDKAPAPSIKKHPELRRERPDKTNHERMLGRKAVREEKQADARTIRQKEVLASA